MERPDAEITLTVPSEVRWIDWIHASAETVAATGGLDEGECLDLALAVREAAINAIVHGNKEDPGKRITVVLRWASGCFQASINDQGGGFELADVPDPTSGAGLMTDSGRGLLMIRAYVDRVDFRPGKNGGTEIYLEKVFV
jgi:serine/threonine-protein kinase RsbW